jgi:mRNA interferase MazF
LTGFVMCEQLKSVDYTTRKVRFIEAAPDTLLEDVLSIVEVCIK